MRITNALRAFEKFNNLIDWSNLKSYTYLWSLTSNGSLRGQTLDTKTGSQEAGVAALKLGQVRQRLFEILSSDFYRPHRIASIHSKLFPEIFFSPLSSPTLIYQAIKRLRTYFRECQSSLTIQEMDGGYILTSSRPCQLKIYRGYSHVPSLPKNHQEILSQNRLKILENQFFELKTFTATRAADLLGISRRLAQLELSRAVKDQKLFRVGNGRTAAYHLQCNLGE